MVLGINIKEAPKAVNAYIAKHRLTFPHLLDSEARVASMFAIPGTPTTLLVERTGQVVGGGAGYRDWASKAASQLLESLLKSTDSKTEQR